MKSDIFLIDIDGVACAHAKAICKWVNEKYGLNSTVEDVTTWDHNFGPVSFVTAVKKCYSEDVFILNMEVTDGFHDFLNNIVKIIRVKFITTREASQEATRSWVEMNFGQNYEIIFAQKKIDVSFKYLLDDCPEEIISAAAKGRTSFLLRQPWNDNENTKNSLKDYKQAYFVENFSEIINFLNINS